MPYSTKFKTPFIFLHLTKTAGSSITKSLKKHCSHVTGNGHMTLKNWQKKHKNQNINDYYKFSFVRNPWDKMVSQYHFLVQNHKKWNNIATKGAVNAKTFKTWLQNMHSGKARTMFSHLYMPYLKDLNNNISVDFIGKFENLQNDWNIVCKQLQITNELPKINVSNHKNFKEYYDEETKQIVNDMFSEEIEYFKYTFD